MIDWSVRWSRDEDLRSVNSDIARFQFGSNLVPTGCQIWIVIMLICRFLPPEDHPNAHKSLSWHWVALNSVHSARWCSLNTEHWTLNTEHSGHSEHSEHSEHSVHWTPSGRVIQSSVFGWLFFSLVACTFLPWMKLFICIFCNSMFTLHWLYTVQCSCILRGYIQQILQLTWKSLCRVLCKRCTILRHLLSFALPNARCCSNQSMFSNTTVLIHWAMQNWTSSINLIKVDNA